MDHKKLNELELYLQQLDLSETTRKEIVSAIKKKRKEIDSGKSNFNNEFETSL